jgi:alpha-beta hydrolase superfamily lysophospholipase
MPPPAWQLDLLRLASRLCPTWRISLEAMATKGQPMQVTETTTHQEQMAKTPHYVPRLSLRLLRETGRLMKSAPLRASQWTGPVLVLFTANDPVSSREQVENLLGFFKKDGVAALFLPKSFHLIFHDKEHATAVRELARWLEAWKN